MIYLITTIIVLSPFAWIFWSEYRLSQFRKTVRPQDAVRYAKDNGNFKIVVSRPDARNIVLQNWDDDKLTAADIKDIYPTYYEL